MPKRGCGSAGACPKSPTSRLFDSPGTVFRCAIEPRGSEAAPEGYDVVIEGDGFLYKMVRIIAGTLLMVGMGLAPPETVLVALFSEAAGDTEVPEGASAGDLGAPKSELRRRGVVGPTLPPERLCLEHVEYERDHDSRGSCVTEP